MPGGVDTEENGLFETWRSLGRLEFEEALLQAGFLRTTVEAINIHLRKVTAIDMAPEERIGLESARDFYGLNPDYENWEHGIRDSLSQSFDSEEARSILLAVLGREICGINFLQFHSPTARDRQQVRTQLNDNQSAALCINLASNASLTGLDLSGEAIIGTQKGCTLLAKSLTTNFKLTYLSLINVNMMTDGAEALVNGLEGNTTLQHLDLSFNPLRDEGVGHISNMLCTNTILSHLYLYHFRYGVRGADFISSALERNSSLKFLEFGSAAVGREGIKKILATISRSEGDPTSIGRPRNTTLTGLSLNFVTLNNFCSTSISAMIRSNESLSYLRLYGGKKGPFSFGARYDMRITQRDWLDHIIPALRHNQTLTVLNISYVGGLRGNEIFGEFTDLGYSGCTGLTQIILTSCDLSYEEKDEINRSLMVGRE